MKRLITIILMVIMVFVISGCSDFTRSPIELIKKPSLGINNEKAREVVNSVIGDDSELIGPLQSDEISSVNFFDLDSDGSKEVISFYRNKDEFKIGVLILKNESDEWYLSSHIEDIGQDLLYAKFDDITGDGNYNIILGLQGTESSLNSLSVYDYKDGTYNVQNFNYSHLLIEDINRDGLDDIFTIKFERANKSEALLLYHGIGGFQTAQVALDPNINGYNKISFGKANDKEYAIFLDIGIRNQISRTDLVLFEDGQLRQVLLYDDRSLKPLYVESKDINGDGIIEIGNVVVPESYDIDVDKGIPYLYSWSVFEDELLNLVELNYINQERGFVYTFPEKWYEHITLHAFQTKEGNTLVRFFYIDGANSFKLLNIEAIRKALWSDYKLSTNLAEKDKYYIVLDEDDEYIYISYADTKIEFVPEEYKAIFEELKLSTVEIRNGFRLER